MMTTSMMTVVQPMEQMEMTVVQPMEQSSEHMGMVDRKLRQPRCFPQHQHRGPPCRLARGLR